jgi:hypothetical protein
MPKVVHGGYACLSALDVFSVQAAIVDLLMRAYPVLTLNPAAGHRAEQSSSRDMRLRAYISDALGTDLPVRASVISSAVRQFKCGAGALLLRLSFAYLLGRQCPKAHMAGIAGRDSAE